MPNPFKYGQRAFRSFGFAIGAAALALPGAAALAAAPCTGPGAPTTTNTRCLTAISIPGTPLQSFDISWVDPVRQEYFLADRSNKGVDVISTRTLAFERTITGQGGMVNGHPAVFVGIKLTGSGAVDNNHSGPDGVTSHGRWLYVGDGDSTLKVIDEGDIFSPIKQIVSTGGTTRLDEMALTADGLLLLAANNAEDPPFATLFAANGDNNTSAVTFIAKVTVDSSIIPSGAGLSLEQPTWDPKTKRFYTSIPIIADNPTGCNYGQNHGAITCDGGLLVTDPVHPPAGPQGAFDATTNTGVVPLHACGPNGATVGPSDNLLLGCTPNNNSSDTTTLVINAKTKNYANIGGITGSDEVWFNSGDSRYYTGSSGAIKPASSPLGRGSVLGVIDGSSVLIETIPQSSGSHSVAADAHKNLIFVPQIWTVPAGTNPAGDANTTAGVGSPTVGQQICGGTNGCIAVYKHDVDNDEEDERAENKINPLGFDWMEGLFGLDFDNGHFVSR